MNRSDLHNYQHKAIDFICSKRKGALWMFMGAGKSVITLTALSDLLSASIVRRVLIIAPLRVARSVWGPEAKKWDHLSHLKVAVAVGTAKERRDAIEVGAEVTVINKENVVWLVALCAEEKVWPFDAVVIDESSCVKNQNTKIFRSLSKVAPHTTILVELTGTPAPNSLMDVWSQMKLLDDGKALGRGITAFRQRFFSPDYWGYSWEIKPGSADKIHSLIAPMVLSMQGEDYIQLPDRIDLIEKVVLPDAVMKAYEDFEKELFMEFEDGQEVEAMSAAVMAGKLLQFANGAIYTDDKGAWKPLHSTKLDALSEIIDENRGENVLVAYNYKHDLARLRKRFPSAVVLDKDPKTIERWNAGEIPLLLCHPQSAGHGINLQHGGSLLIWFGLTWSLESYQQLCARLWRQGQERPVRVVHLVARETIDERVLGVLGQKDAVQNDLLKALRG